MITLGLSPAYDPEAISFVAVRILLVVIVSTLIVILLLVITLLVMIIPLMILIVLLTILLLIALAILFGGGQLRGLHAGPLARLRAEGGGGHEPLGPDDSNVDIRSR